MMKYVPGPGSYSPKFDIGDKTNTSNFKESRKTSFYHNDRFSKNIRNKGI